MPGRGLCRNQLSPVQGAEQFWSRLLRDGLGKQAHVGVFRNHGLRVSRSRPDFVAVTRDEFVGLGGRGWKVAGLWVTKPQDISIFRNFGEGGWCSYENVAVFVFR